MHATCPANLITKGSRVPHREVFQDNVTTTITQTTVSTPIGMS